MSSALLACALAGVAAAPDPAALFSRGNELYAEGRFGESLAAYTEAAAAGGDPGTLSYNRGNCLFRLGRFSEALHAFLVAERCRPRDSRVGRNLAAAGERLGTKTLDCGGFSNQLQRLAATFTPAEYRAAAIALAALYLLACAAAFGRGRNPRLSWAAGLLGPALLLLLLSAAAGVGPRGRIGVALPEATTVHSEPSGGSAALFSLKEGEVVAVAGRRPGWLQVEDSQGNRGWASDAAVLEVRPARPRRTEGERRRRRRAWQRAPAARCARGAGREDVRLTDSSSRSSSGGTPRSTWSSSSSR